MMSRRAKGWLLVAGVAVVGAAVGVLAGFLLGDRIAGAVTGVVLAVLGVFGARGRALVDRGAEVRTVLPDQVLGGRLQRVRELKDPVLLGVHPAAWDESGQVPTYVTRDVDDRVDEAVRVGGFVLLSGESTAGKTRVAYEAMRRVLPDHHLVAPASREAVRTVVETVVDQRRCVVWLDDVERFFGVHGLTVPLLDRMLAADAVVLGTIRVGELDRFGARHEADSDDRDGWRAAREVLRRAIEIPVPRRWSGPELDRASRSTDRRVRSALRMTDTFGLAELLADGPELARDWQNGWRPGGHPRGASLVAAAVDCRRAGLSDPVPIELLAELAEHYLDARGGATLRPEALDDAENWARKPARGASSLLIPAGDDRVLAFDYLIDLATEALRGMSPDDRETLRLRGMLARFTHKSGKTRKAGRMFAELLEDCHARLGPDHPETLETRLQAAVQLGECKSHDEAVRRLAELVDDNTRVLGPDHHETLRARQLHATWMGRGGDRPHALELSTALLADRLRVQGPDHANTLSTRFYIAVWTDSVDRTSSCSPSCCPTAPGCSASITRTRCRSASASGSSPAAPACSTSRPSSSRSCVGSGRNGTARTVTRRTGSRASSPGSQRRLTSRPTGPRRAGPRPRRS